jgi:hypothetical protein
MIIPTNVQVTQDLVKVTVKFDCLGKEYVREYAWAITQVMGASETQAKNAIIAKVTASRNEIEAAQAQLTTLFTNLLSQDIEPSGP